MKRNCRVRTGEWVTEGGSGHVASLFNTRSVFQALQANLHGIPDRLADLSAWELREALPAGIHVLENSNSADVRKNKKYI